MDDFAYAVTNGFKRYFDFKDRSARYEFWYWFLFSFVLNFIAGIMDGSLVSGESGLASSIVMLGLFIPGISVLVRRLHDIGRTGWWALLVFIPIIGHAVLIYFAVQPSEAHFNRFGENPFVRREAEESGEDVGDDEGRKRKNIETHQSTD